MKLKEQELNEEFQLQKQKNETTFLRLSKISSFLEKMLTEYLVSQNIYFEFDEERMLDVLQSERLKFVDSGFLNRLEQENREVNIKQEEEFNLLKYQITKMKENYDKKKLKRMQRATIKFYNLRRKYYS